MPINKKAMSNLKKEYGDKKGENIYYALENEGKIKPKNTMENKEIKDKDKEIQAKDTDKESDKDIEIHRDNLEGKPDYEKMYNDLKSNMEFDKRTKSLNDKNIDEKHHEYLMDLLKDRKDMSKDLDNLSTIFRMPLKEKSVEDSLKITEPKKEVSKEKTMGNNFGGGKKFDI